MSIEWWRDLAICILGLGTLIVMLSLGVLAFLLYRRLKRILKSLEGTAKTVKDISSCVEAEVIKPIGQIAALVQGIGQGIGMMGKFTKKEE